MMVPHTKCKVTHLAQPHLQPDNQRLVIRPFVPNAERIRSIIDRVAAMPQEQIQRELEDVISLFQSDHGDLIERFKEYYNMAMKTQRAENKEQLALSKPKYSAEQLKESRAAKTEECMHSDQKERRAESKLQSVGRLLAGAYFTSEYAFEATALFNPSIVWAPVCEQKDAVLDSDSSTECIPYKPSQGFILSARSVGEGHVSSISFRTGQIDEAGNVSIDPVRRTAMQGKLRHLQGARHLSSGKQLENSKHLTGMSIEKNDVTEISFRKTTPISQRLIFPSSADERGGMEDARFVRFVQDDGSITYYATYTAYDGHNILPKLIETTDFGHFCISKLAGKMALNKGMALFPRKIGGQYVMLSRIDGESLYIMFSRELLAWNTAIKIAAPLYPWEFMQIGNCGSPIEMPEGWLVLTHGVGSLRRYSIGAMLLDKDDPAKVIGRLAVPLISPDERERMGYVPNVVYTCGSIIHGGNLVIPYGSADFSIGFITVNVKELMQAVSK
ncbi:MAG: glycoside hydrolase family 130 protein [Termitinemataceae bacterium]|nr:MAG: glycoside hydrolase family 130 protein [Termitinemataceae bacterium]